MIYGARIKHTCNPDVFDRGETIFVTHTIPAAQVEAWVRKVAERSGQNVDWFYMGGRAVVKVLGDFDKAREAVVALKPEHDELYRDAVRDIWRGHDMPDEEIMRACPGLGMWWK